MMFIMYASAGEADARVVATFNLLVSLQDALRTCNCVMVQTVIDANFTWQSLMTLWYSTG